MVYTSYQGQTERRAAMTRLSITLTDSQAEQLERIACETGATKQSMIGLAVTAWLRQYAAVPARRPYNRRELEAYLGDCASDFDLEAIEREITVTDAHGRVWWAVDEDELPTICSSHELALNDPTFTQGHIHA